MLVDRFAYAPRALIVGALTACGGPPHNERAAVVPQALHQPADAPSARWVLVR